MDNLLVPIERVLSTTQSRYLRHLIQHPAAKGILVAIAKKREQVLKQSRYIVTSPRYKFFTSAGIPLSGEEFTITPNESGYVLKLDQVLSALPKVYLDELFLLVSCFKTSSGFAADIINDFSIHLSAVHNKRYSGLRQIKAVLIHELTHIKDVLAQKLIPNYKLQLEKIYQVSEAMRKEHITATTIQYMTGGEIWFNKSKVSETSDTSGDINTQEIRFGNHYGNLIYRLEMNFKTGKVLSLLGYEGKLRDVRTIPQHTLEKMLKPLRRPRFGFIYKYAATKERMLFKQIGRELNLPIEINNIKLYHEDIPNIVEEYYRNPQYFREIIFTSKSEKIHDLYSSDVHALYPLIRKKVRLLSEYGFLPKIA